MKAVDKPLLPGADAGIKSKVGKGKSAKTAATKSKTEDEAVTAKSKIGGVKSAMAKTMIPSGAAKPTDGPPKPGTPPAAGITVGPPKPGGPPAPGPAKPTDGLPKPPPGAPPPPPDSAAGTELKKEDVKSKKEDFKSKKEEPAKTPEAGTGEKDVKSDVGLRVCFCINKITF